MKKKKKIKMPSNTKDIHEAAKEIEVPVLEGVIRYKNGYAVVVAGKVKEVYPGSDAFQIASKSYNQHFKPGI